MVTEKDILIESMNAWLYIHAEMDIRKDTIEKKKEEIAKLRKTRNRYRYLKTMKEDILEEKNKEIANLRGEIELLIDLNEKAWSNSYWQDIIVKPVFDAVIEYFPNVTWESKAKYNTFGIENRVPLYGKYNDKTILVEVKPLKLPFLTFNDFGVTEKLDNIQQLFDNVEEQIKSYGN